MFVGDTCELCTNSNWDVRAKGYKDARNEGPSGTFDRGSNQQAWQNANYKTTLSQCKNPPQPFAIPSAGNAATATAAPPEPVLPPPTSIPGVLEAVQSWKVVWSWPGNNVDGPIPGETNSGVFDASPKGIVSQYGKDVPPANGIILSPDGKTLYVTNGAIVYAFDVKADGSLTNQRQFGTLQGGEGGDGSAVDQQG